MSFIFLSCREKVHNNKEFSDKISKSCIQTVDYKKKKKKKKKKNNKSCHLSITTELIYG